MKKQFHLTPDGVDELKTELAELVGQRGEVAEKIKSAREFGDLTENAEYATAMQEQERSENRIAEIEHILQNVDLIKKPRGNHSIHLGSQVQLKSQAGKAKSYKIVGTVEANPSEGKISDESPIGQALMGKTVGDSVEINMPAETVTYKIVDIA